MQLLRWSDEYSVGIDAIDYEHKQLIDLINKLHDELDSTDLKQNVAGFFAELLKGISAHFALEEKFMRDHAYAYFGPHKDDHERLLDELRDIMDAFEHAGEVDAVDLGQKLDTWFTRHFRTHDAELHRRLGAHAGDSE